MVGKYDFSDISIKWAGFEFVLVFYNNGITLHLIKDLRFIASIYPEIPREEQAEAMRVLASGDIFCFGKDETLQLGFYYIQYNAGAGTNHYQYLGLTEGVIEQLKQILTERFDKPKVKLPNELETAIKAFGCHEDKVRDLVIKLRGER